MSCSFHQHQPHNLQPLTRLGQRQRRPLSKPSWPHKVNHLGYGVCVYALSVCMCESVCEGESCRERGEAWRSRGTHPCYVLMTSALHSVVCLQGKMIRCLWTASNKTVSTEDCPWARTNGCCHYLLVFLLSSLFLCPSPPLPFPSPSPPLHLPSHSPPLHSSFLCFVQCSLMRMKMMSCQTLP